MFLYIGEVSIYDQNRFHANYLFDGVNLEKSKVIQVFQSCPEPYQSYTVQEPIFANNYAELEQKVNEYLENLINKINEPLVECSHCKGHGVITKN